MLLRADAPQEGRGVLKLTGSKSGLAAELTVEALPEGEVALYLFEKDSKAHRVGGLANGRLKATLTFPALADIAGAAVVREPGNVFLLKSSGMDWDGVVTRFRIPRIAGPPASRAAASEVFAAPAQTQGGERPAEPEPGAAPERAREACAAPAQGVCNTCPHVIRQDKINPFPAAFPQSEWVRISYPGPAGWWHYISGKIYRGGALVAKVLGVPGEYGMAPPIWLEGFGTYMRCASPDAHGYWLMFQDAQTGEVLDMGLSPRDG